MNPRRKQRTRAFECARAMPPLTHWRDRSQPWTPAQSDVVAWLASQPSIASYIFNRAADAGAIVYDVERKLWRGVGQPAIAAPPPLAPSPARNNTSPAPPRESPAYRKERRAAGQPEASTTHPARYFRGGET
ncbi:MAG: hypothetical protein LBM04_10735 [Opitutaceae bacterium]|jgi:hypothetical protein|nr:hypothetical protein [Opitutaceae bacterium]